MTSVERVLLQTATVPIQSNDGSKTISVKILLDSVSHHTFMTDRLAKQLQLVPQYQEALSASTFAARKPQDVNSYVVKFNLVTKDRCCLQLHANVVKQITGPIQRGPLQLSDMDILLSISPDKLAGTIPWNMEPSTVDLLIGSDYFWSIIGTEKTTLPSGLFLVSSRIGYIVTHIQLEMVHIINSKDLLIGSDYFWSIIGTEKTTLLSGLFLVSSRIGYIVTHIQLEMVHQDTR